MSGKGDNLRTLGPSLLVAIAWAIAAVPLFDILPE